MPFNGKQARVRLQNACAAHDAARAIQAAFDIIRHQPSLPNISFINRECAAVAPALLPVRVALLASFSTEFLAPFHTASGYASGLHLQVYQAPFGNYTQEVLDPASGLYRFKPDVAILAVEGRDAAPQWYEHFHETLVSPETSVPSPAADLAALAREISHQTEAMVLLHNFAPPVYPALGIADANLPNSQRAQVMRDNSLLSERLREIPGAYVVDIAALVARFGALAWYDNRLAHYAKSPIAMSMLPHLAGEHLRFIRSKFGKTRKCLVLDLDNTLWGGVLGEDGVANVQLGPQYPGSAFVSFQHSLLALRRRGVLLAIASKNNRADVDEMFAAHPHMVLKYDDFAAIEIHWREKAESLNAIAARLGLGLEHMVFVDDNPAECERVRDLLPQVTTLALPAQPESYADFLFADGLFDAPTLSSEDLRRTDLYRTRAAAASLREQAATLEDFYRGLQMRVAFEPVGPASLARAAQLTQKTNQFNATTRRLSESEIQARLDSPEWLCTTVRVADRFGDHGTVGLLLARVEGEQMVIDTFLLSCRVIGRTVESSMLAYLYAEAQAHKLRAIMAEIIPTPKNLPVRDVFERHGFAALPPGEDGRCLWLYQLSSGPLSHPQWLSVDVQQSNDCALQQGV